MAARDHCSAQRIQGCPIEERQLFNPVFAREAVYRQRGGSGFERGDQGTLNLDGGRDRFPSGEDRFEDAASLRVDYTTLGPELGVNLPTRKGSQLPDITLVWQALQ